MATQTLQPTTLAGASVVIQVFLLFISFVALWLLTKSYVARAAARNSYSALVIWLLLTLVIILMGEDLYATWSPILGSLQLPNVPRDYAFLSVFVLDIFFVTVLVLKTGGTKRSPFTSVLLLLPSLAIFLREPILRFLLYSATVGVVYVVLLRKSLRKRETEFDRSSYDAPSRSDEQADDWATIWTNITCLALATLIGVITQPRIGGQPITYLGRQL